MRLRFAALCAMAVAVSPAVGQDQKTPVRATLPDRQAQLDAITTEFFLARKLAVRALRTARTDDERKAAEEKEPKAKDFLPRVQALIAADATDEVAADALMFAVFGLDATDEKVFDALARNFVKTNKIERFVQAALRGAPTAAKPVLEKVLADNPSPELKGMAAYALGTMAFFQEDGKGEKEAAAYFERVQKEFPDVKGPQGDTLGELAKGNLYELKHLAVGMKAPAAESKTLDGKKATLADYAGKVVVLDFWATFCPPCRAMIPDEREMVERFRDKPFALISVSADDEKRELEDFLVEVKMPWTHWWDGPEAPLLKEWNVHIYPKVFVIDGRGVIRAKHVHGKALEATVEKLLAETK